MAKKFEDLDANLTGEGSSSDEPRSSWFKRIKKGINTRTSEKMETPEGLWNKCPECSHICTSHDLKDNFHICPKCSYHFRINSDSYYEIIFRQ